MNSISAWVRRVRDEDAGSLAVAMMLTLVGVSLSGLLVPVVVDQLHTASQAFRRDRALNAAQSGIEIAMAQIRAASVTGTTAAAPLVGVRDSLKCLYDTPQASDKLYLAEGNDHPQTGKLGPSSTFAVSTLYLTNDPSQVTADPFTDFPAFAGQAGLIPCTSSTMDPLGNLLAAGKPKSVPLFALLVSTGVDTAGGGTAYSRKLTATYVFTTTTPNISGGLIHVYKTATSQDLCLDAASSSPTVGANVIMRPCSPGSNSQKFGYNANLTLSLSATTVGGALGMCLDAGPTHAVGNYVVFSSCASTTVPRQQWSINNSANFEGTTDGKTLDGYCFNVQSPDVSGSFVVLGKASTKCYNGYDNIETWQPEASTGAGAAGPAIGELIDFSQFGRCLDVTEGNVNYQYLIAWPCKQAPDPAGVSWNQRWALPAVTKHNDDWYGTGRVTTSPSSGTYCLLSPRSTAAGKYVSVTLCDPQNPDNQKWTVYNSATSPYDSFTVKDVDNHCLQPTDPTVKAPDFYPKGQNISKIIVAVCNGGPLQKWNAPPTVLNTTPLKDVGEK